MLYQIKVKAMLINSIYFDINSVQGRTCLYKPVKHWLKIFWGDFFSNGKTEKKKAQSFSGVFIFQMFVESIIDGMQLLKTEPCCVPTL